MKKRHITGILALGAASTLALAGCSGSIAGGDTSDGGGDKGTITLGFIPSWTDGLSMAYLTKNQLEKLGYTVELETIPDAGPLYAALSEGDIDVYPSSWPEVTHAAYIEKYGDALEDLGAYYDNAVLTIAVPEYVDIDSIADLKANADRFDGKIYGIEPGAGLTKMTQETMIPTYGLEDSYELVTSSTSAMLAQLDEAIKNKEDIVVTLWRPFWANSAYPVKDLTDPEGGMGESEALHFTAHAGFADEFPEAAEFIAGIQLDDAAYNALEDLVVNEYGAGKEAEAVEAFLEKYPDAFETEIAD